MKILDFGLARLDDDSGESSTTLTQEGSVMGTLDYIAPEQATDSHQVDIRADLYSLGCTFFYLLAGRPPFPGGEALAKLLKHRFDPPPPLTSLRPDAPPALEAIINKLLAKQPGDRFQTPAELLVALHNAEQGGYSTAAVQPPVATAGPVESTDSSSAGETVADHWADIVSDSSTRHPAPLRAGSAQRGPAGFGPWWRYAGIGVAVVILAVCLWRPWQTPQTPAKLPGGPVEPMVQDKVYLTDMQEYNVQTHPNYKFTKDGRASNGDELLADGRHTPNGIYMVPPSQGQAQVQYLLARQFMTFTTGVALRDGASADPGVTFKIVGDGRVLWKSEPVEKAGRVQDCEVPVKGIRQLDIVVECPGDASNAGAIWVEPLLQTIPHAASRPLVIQGRASGRESRTKLTSDN